MRAFVLLFLMTATAYGQELEIQTRPESVYVETMTGNLTPIERVFFHIILHNASNSAVDIQWVRFDIVNSAGVLVSGQYSGPALMSLFDSAVDRRRIEPTAKQTLTLGPDERKGISDIFFDCPIGFIGETLLVEVDYRSAGKPAANKISSPLRRVAGFSGRLPFDGVWYVSSEHGYLDPHKRFLPEAFAYDFLQIGANGKSFQRDGSRNNDYYAYGKKVLAAADGTVAYVRGDIVENNPGTPNINTPGGNVVIIDHGNSQFSYYAHLKPNSINVRAGAKIKAGDPIGEVGNSGDSLEPHLHFHAMNNVDVMQADGVPAVFAKWKAQAYGREPVVREMGILPRGEFVQP